MAKLASILLGVFFVTSIFAQKPGDLSGNWQIKTYYSTLRDTVLASSIEKNCTDLLMLSINKKGKMKFIFTDKKDSVVFAGQIKFKKNGVVKIDHNIHESTYLGELEKCITPGLREDMKRIFFRTFACAVEQDQLLLYYSLPTDLKHKKTMVLVRQPVHAGN